MESLKKDLFCGIDLHSNNNYIVVIDDNDKKLLEKKSPNDLDHVIRLLKSTSVQLFA